MFHLLCTVLAISVYIELQALGININCNASLVLYYRSRLFSINHWQKGDSLGVHWFSSPPFCVFNTMTSWSKYDLRTGSDLTHIDQRRMWGKLMKKFKDKLHEIGSKTMAGH